MRKALRPLLPTLAVAGAALLLAACSSTSAPTAADPPAATARTVAAAASVPPSPSALIRGLVVDAANRPVPSANVECASNAQCRRYAEVSAQDGPDDGVKTDASGRYVMVVSPSTNGSFLLGASAFGYGIVWRSAPLPDPACSWDQARCALTVNFALNPAP